MKKYYVSKTVRLGKNVNIYPGVYIEGTTVIGNNCTIYPNTYIRDSIIGDNCIIKSSYITDSELVGDNQIGPFANIHSNSLIEKKVIIGTAVEIKKSIIKEGTKIKHLSFVGDAELCENVNIGGGTIIANYDGKNHNKSTIKEGSFIGANSTIISPVTIEEKCVIGAGSVINKDVPKESLAIARTRQVNKEGYYKGNK